MNSTNPLFITLAILTFIISQIIPSIILYPLSLHFMPEAKGKISAVIQGARLILAAISLQIAGYFYQGTFQDIGIIICVFILFAIVTLFFVIRSHELMDTLRR